MLVSDINISQGNVATSLVWYDLREILKSVSIWGRYRQEYGVMLVLVHVYYT